MGRRKMKPHVPPSRERLVRVSRYALLQQSVCNILEGVRAQRQLLLRTAPHVDHEPPDLPPFRRSQ